MATEDSLPIDPPAPTEKETASTAEAPALPGFYTDPNFVLGNSSAAWRYGKPPDYSKTRRLFAETKSQNHSANSLPQLVENLVKNWEIEASFKTKLEDWQTVNPSRYTFSMNGGTPQKGEHMLEVGSYNSIISPNEYYSPEYSDFASTHKTFKRMMPFFAWEVLEVYSGPPKVAFRWRHWGQMKNDYVGFNNRAEKVTAKAHGGWIDIQGITVADLDGDMKIVHLETWFDPMDMFRQIAPKGIVNKQPMNSKTLVASPELPTSDTTPEVAASSVLSLEAHHDNQSLADHEPAGPLLPHEASQEDIAQFPERDVEFFDAHEHPIANVEANTDVMENGSSPASKQTITAQEVVNAKVKPDKSKTDIKANLPPIDKLNLEDANTESEETQTANAATEEIDAEAQIKPERGEAVAVSNGSVETTMTHEEMSRITPAECPFFNRE
ncbi:hypothetical protein EG327_007719 [Venturia inaequalis]|uniref:Pathogen-related protein n=1 Tax=Venturia inaequalis TaxID=5025 RepID=A0A8H3VPT7_VENIN|nr:hypothetical protein EG327_007719 [Venturia inaequalis]